MRILTYLNITVRHGTQALQDGECIEELMSDVCNSRHLLRMSLNGGERISTFNLLLVPCSGGGSKHGTITVLDGGKKGRMDRWELFLLDYFFIRLLNFTSDAAKLIVNNSSVHL